MQGRAVLCVAARLRGRARSGKGLTSPLFRRLTDYRRFVLQRGHHLSRCPERLRSLASSQPTNDAVQDDIAAWRCSTAKKGSGVCRTNRPAEGHSADYSCVVDVGSEVYAVAYLEIDCRPHVLNGSKDGVLRLLGLASAASCAGVPWPY